MTEQEAIEAFYVKCDKEGLQLIRPTFAEEYSDSYNNREVWQLYYNDEELASVSQVCGEIMPLHFRVRLTHYMKRQKAQDPNIIKMRSSN